MPFDEQGNWKPNPKQAQFLSIPDTVPEATYLGGAGSGKSEVLLMLPIVRKWHEVRGFKQLFTRRTFPELKREIVPRSFDIYPKFGGVFNKIDMCWTFESGAMIFFGHCENESDVHQYDSMEINLFTPDEVTSYTEEIYMYISFTRVRTSNPKLPAIVRAAGMPGGIGHVWVKKRFEPNKLAGKLIVGRGGNKRICIFATQEDNKENIDPNYGQKLDALPEAERQAKKFGNFDAYSGQVFSEFREKRYPDEPENAMHYITPFAIPDYWPKVVAIDWGFNSLTSVGFAAISPTNRAYIYRHLMFSGMKITDWTSVLKPFVDKEQPQDIVICHSANQHRGEPHTIQEQVSEALGRSVRLGERDRVAGKMLIHEYLRWTAKSEIITPDIAPYDEKMANWIYRNSGPDEYKKYLELYQAPAPETNIPKLLLFDTPDCKVIGDSLKACVYEKSSGDGKMKEDVAEFNGDDPYDMLRMLLHAVDGFHNLAAETKSRLDAMQKIIDQYKTSGDNTAYYRNMRQFESGDRGVAVRRFHRGRRH